MEPGLEILKFSVYRTQEAYDRSKGRITCSRRIENQKKAGQIAGDRDQLIDVLDLDRN
jgi:hypothetical protein